MKKDILTTLIGIIGAAVSKAYGGWDTSMSTLLIFMAIDYLSGLVLAGVFNASPKSKTGALESKAGFKGLCRKGMTLLVVLIAYRLDLALDTDYIKSACIIAFITNEAISIIENAGLMGLPIPQRLVQAIEVLKANSLEDKIKTAAKESMMDDDDDDDGDIEAV